MLDLRSSLSKTIVLMIVSQLMFGFVGCGAKHVVVDGPGASTLEADDGDQASQETEFQGSVAGAAALSAIFPGAGHFYLKDWRTGAGLTSLGGATLTAVAVTLFDGWPKKSSQTDLSDPTLLLAGSWYQNSLTYGIFAAYRDARLLKKNRGYRYPAPQGSLTDLLLAPINPKVMFKPEVGFGLVGMLALGLLATYFVNGSLTSETTLGDRNRVNFMGRSMPKAAGVALGELYYLGLFVPVGIGEEALFRGVIQSSLSEYLGDWGGLTAASMIFGAAHAPNALMLEDRREQLLYLSIQVPCLMILGGYMGWVYKHNGYSLKESVALHFWYDLLLSTVYFIGDPDNQPFSLRFSLPF